MFIRPGEERKTTATSLAEALASGITDTKIICPLLEQLGYPASIQSGAASPVAKKPVGTGNIGIYAPQVIEGATWYYREVRYKERWKNLDKWKNFANVDRIPPKGSQKRIVLIGESVARGFFIDPGYTPAFVLESMLAGTMPDGQGVEVVDLGETNLTMAGLRQRYQECLALEPDMVIFFAGNNWRNDLGGALLSHEQLASLGQVLQQQKGIKGLKQHLEKVLAQQIESLFSYLHSLTAGKIKLLFIIPEFNLLDWRSSPGEQLITKLPGEGTRQWVQAKQLAESARDNSDWETAKQHASRMIDLDPTHPLGFEILADCQIAQGDHEAARNNLELARDTALFFRATSKPRTFRIIQETILSQAKQYQIEVTDLRTLFFAHLKGRVPGRTLFFDYCHLTPEGIAVAMEAVARQAIILLSGAPPVAAIKPAPSAESNPELLATAHLLAATHNAHWGQSYEIVLYHCKKSLQFSKKMASLLISHCDMVTRRATNVLCQSLEQQFPVPEFERYVYVFRNPKHANTMELDLVNAMVTALQQAGIDIGAQIEELRNKEHGIEQRPANLLHAFYHLTSRELPLGTRTAYFQAHAPLSRFFLPATKNTAITITLTARIPAGASGKAVLLLNQCRICEIALSPTWSDHQILLPENNIINGINELAIEWPVPVHDLSEYEPIAAALSPATAELLFDAVFCVFGEMMRFTATTNATQAPVPAVSLTDRQVTGTTD
jgi:hypothetical protein